MTDWLEDEHDGLDLGKRRWPLSPTDLLPRERGCGGSNCGQTC